MEKIGFVEKVVMQMQSDDPFDANNIFEVNYYIPTNDAEFLWDAKRAEPTPQKDEYGRIPPPNNKY